MCHKRSWRHDRLGLPLLYEIRAFWEDAAVGNGTAREGSVKYRLTRLIEGWAVRRADAVAVICDGLRSDLLARGVDPRKIMVSPNGVDLDLFGAPPARDTVLAKQLNLGSGPVVGFIGSFYDYEGLDILIAAMPALVAAVPGVQLMLVGGGPMEEPLRASVEASPPDVRNSTTAPALASCQTFLTRHFLVAPHCLVTRLRGAMKLPLNRPMAMCFPG